MTKTYGNLDSTAINQVVIDKHTVKVVYKSNISKEYTYNCSDILQFQLQLEQIVSAKEEGFIKHSIGSFINQRIKEGMLVESK